MDKEFEEKIKTLNEASKNFYFFTLNIFAKSFSNFIGGPYIEECCNYIQKYIRTMRIAFRSGFKSTELYDYTMYNIMFRGMKEDLDIQYFSYSADLSGWHIQQIKSLIAKNPYFKELHNLKPLAENVALYSWDKKHFIKIRPSGILSFSRGHKSNIIFADDILSDPSNPIHPTVILKVNELFKSVILESLVPGGEIHVAGSPLSRADLYFDPALQKEFNTKFYPAITKDQNGNEISTWPEFYTLEQLKAKIPVMGEKAFASEMMVHPFYSTDSFFKKEQLRKTVVNSQLRNIPLVQGLDTKNLVIAGFDIGKKRHPAILSVFEIKDGKAIQIHRKKMIKWPYYRAKPYDPMHPSQVEYWKEAIKNFGIDTLYYDNTRGEFEGAKDSGLLTPQFIPIVFSVKSKIQMATEFEKIILNKQIEIFDDEEMLNSICSVTNDLQKIESASGDHSDDFDSICLALIGFSKSEMSGKMDKEIRIGCKSIFESPRPPKGW